MILCVVIVSSAFAGQKKEPFRLACSYSNARKSLISSELGFGAAGFLAGFSAVFLDNEVNSSGHAKSVDLLKAAALVALAVAAARDLQKKTDRYDTVSLVAGVGAGIMATQVTEASFVCGSLVGSLAGGLAGEAVGLAARAVGTNLANAGEVGLNIGIYTGGTVGAMTGILTTTVLTSGALAITAVKAREIITPDDED